MRVLPTQFRPALDQLPIDDRMAKIKRAAKKAAKPPTMAVQNTMAEIVAVIGTRSLKLLDVLDALPSAKRDCVRYALRRLAEDGRIVLCGKKMWRVA